VCARTCVCEVGFRGVEDDRGLRERGEFGAVWS
jgi:hypothetical protein